MDWDSLLAGNTNVAVGLKVRTQHGAGEIIEVYGPYFGKFNYVFDVRLDSGKTFAYTARGVEISPLELLAQRASDEE